MIGNKGLNVRTFLEKDKEVKKESALLNLLGKC